MNRQKLAISDPGAGVATATRPAAASPAAPAVAAPPALQVADLGKSFRSGLLRRRLPGIEGVSFTVPPGEIFALLGHNGAGKTTTINCILDLCHAETGAVSIFGVDHRQAHSRRRVGYLPERPYFFDHLTGAGAAALLRQAAGPVGRGPGPAHRRRAGAGGHGRPRRRTPAQDVQGHAPASGPGPGHPGGRRPADPGRAHERARPHRPPRGARAAAGAEAAGPDHPALQPHRAGRGAAGRHGGRAQERPAGPHLHPRRAGGRGGLRGQRGRRRGAAASAGPAGCATPSPRPWPAGCASPPPTPRACARSWSAATPTA